MPNNEQQQSKEAREQFEQHLTDAVRIVQKWPDWKKGLLGGTASQPPTDTEPSSANTNKRT